MQSALVRCRGISVLHGRTHGGRLDYRIYDKSSAERAAALLDECRGAPTLALLDPDGIDIPFELVRQFGNRPRTEVLLSFDVQALLRCAEIGDGPAVSRFFGDDVSWRRLRAADGALDPVALLELYRQTLARDHLFRFTSVQRLVFTSLHANRAIAQGCGSTKGTEKWLEAFASAAASHGARLAEVASDFERRAAFNGAIELLRSLAGADRVLYGAIHQHVGRFNLLQRDLHQVLLFLRERELLSWSSRLHRDAVPPPRFRFAATWPERLIWDGVERALEQPRPAIAEQGGRPG